MEYNLFFSNTVSQYGFGEDQLYFSRIDKLGEKIIWNKNPVFEIVQKERENIKWFLKRNFKYGLTGILIESEIYGFLKAFLLNFIKLIYNLCLSIYYLLILPFNPISNFYKCLGFFLDFWEDRLILLNINNGSYFKFFKSNIKIYSLFISNICNT